MEDVIYEEFEVQEIRRENDGCKLSTMTKKVIAEISLKIIVNGIELVSLLCLNQHQEELALGFLYSEGVVNSIDDIQEIDYNERMLAVTIQLKEGIHINKQESLRSITSGCGKCYTYINPLKKSQYLQIQNDKVFSMDMIFSIMKEFMQESEIFMKIGGVHSLLFYTPEYKILNEDIGRHNCFDKITGILVKNRKLNISKNAILFVSGRISSEIMTKIVRLGTPVLVSRSTPTTAAVRLAKQYNVTLLGYVRGNRGYVYSCPERLVM